MTDTRTVNPRLAPNERGVYEIRWTENHRSKRISTNTSDASHAQVAFARWLLSRDEEKRRDTDPHVGDILDQYIREHVREKVVDQDRQEDCCAVLAKGLGDMRPKELTAEVIAKYKLDRMAGLVNGRKVGNGTLRRELNVLMAAINHARKQRRIPADSVPYVQMPPPPPPKDIWLTEDELSKLLEQANDASDAVRMFTHIAAHTASRKNAVMRLTWDRISFDHGTIDFQNDGGPRTNKRRVQVPMTSGLAVMLSAEYERQGRPPLSRRVINLVSIDRPFKDLVNKVADITENEKFRKVTPHTLRHTWATLAAKNRVPIFEIAGVLGDTVQTVQRVYAKHHPDHLRGAVGFMDGLAPTGQGDRQRQTRAA